MAFRPLLLSAVVGMAALGLFHSPAADAQGYLSINIGTPAPYAGYGYGHGHRPGYALVPGHYVRTHHGRVWVPAQYVRVQPTRRDYDRYDRRYDRRYLPGYGYDRRVIPPPSLRPLPGGFYYQRGGQEPRDYYSRDPHRGW